MLSKNAFLIIYGVGVLWFLSAALYTFKAVIKDYIELGKSKHKEI